MRGRRQATDRPQPKRHLKFKPLVQRVNQVLNGVRLPNGCKILVRTLVDIEASRSGDYKFIAMGYGGKPYRRKGKVYNRTRGLAEETGTSRSTCIRSVQALERLKLIRCDSPKGPTYSRRGGRSLANHYTVGEALEAPEPVQDAPLPRDGRAFSQRLVEDYGAPAEMLRPTGASPPR